MGLIDEHLPVVAPGDGSPGSGKPGISVRHNGAARKIDAIGDLVTDGYLSETGLTAKFVERPSSLHVASSGGATSLVTAGPSKVLNRIAVRVPQKVKRWRLRYQNYNAATDVIGAQDVTLNAAIGSPVYDAFGVLTGNIVGGTGVQVVTNALLAGGHAPYYTAWADAAGLLVSPGQMLMVSLHVSTSVASGARSWQRANVPAWFKNEANLTDLIAGAVTVGSTSPVYGDLALQFECEADDSILVVGDSYADGFGAVQPNTISGTHLSVAARLHDVTGYPVACTAVSGGRLQYFADRDSSSPVWEKVSFDSARYTRALIISHPNNDTTAGRTVAQIQTDFMTVLDKLRAKGVGRVVGCTIPPRGNPAGTTTADVAVGGGSFVSANYNPGAGSIQIGSGDDVETVVVASVAGSGPWTATLTGTFTKAHPAGSIIAIANSNEAKRVVMNTWLRNRPGGVVDVIDLDALYRDPSNPTTLLATKRYDAVHLNGVEQDNVARMAAALLR